MKGNRSDMNWFKRTPKVNISDLTELFKSIWIDKNVADNFRAHESLSDKEYVYYKVWCQMNDEHMYKTHLPNATVVSGSVNRIDKIIFHGGCLNCVSQEITGVGRCLGCQYFRADWNKPDLNVKQGFTKIPDHEVDSLKPKCFEVKQLIEKL